MSAFAMTNNNEYEKSKEYWLRFMVIGFFLLFVAIFSGGPCYQVITSFLIDKNGISTVGKVDSIEYMSNTEIEALRYGFSFEYKGNKYRLFNKIRSNERIYTMDERVNVKFMPDNPDEAIIDSTKEKYTGWIVPIAIGALIISLIISYFIKRK